MACTRTEGSASHVTVAPRFGNGGAEIRYGVIERLPSIDGIHRFIRLRDLGISKQIAQQRFHARSAVSQVIYKFVGVAVEFAAVPPGKELAIDLDAAQWLLKVMAGGIRELLKIAICALQFQLQKL